MPLLLTAPIRSPSAGEWVGRDVPAADPGEDQLDHAGHSLQLRPGVLGSIACGLIAIAAHGPGAQLGQGGELWCEALNVTRSRRLWTCWSNSLLTDLRTLAVDPATSRSWPMLAPTWPNICQSSKLILPPTFLSRILFTWAEIEHCWRKVTLQTYSLTTASKLSSLMCFRIISASTTQSEVSKLKGKNWSKLGQKSLMKSFTCKWPQVFYLNFLAPQ